MGPFEWHDAIRVIVIGVSALSFVRLLRRRSKNAAAWNEKTLDYWYALFVWSIAGFVLAIQGIVLDRPPTPGFALVVAAALVTGRGLHRKGGWGGSS